MLHCSSLESIDWRPCANWSIDVTWSFAAVQLGSARRSTGCDTGWAVVIIANDEAVNRRAVAAGWRNSIISSTVVNLAYRPFFCFNVTYWHTNIIDVLQRDPNSLLLYTRYSTIINDIFPSISSAIQSVRPPIRPPVCSFARSFIRSFVPTALHSFIHSFVCSFVRSLDRSFIHAYSWNTLQSNLTRATPRRRPGKLSQIFWGQSLIPRTFYCSYTTF